MLGVLTNAVKIRVNGYERPKVELRNSDEPTEYETPEAEETLEEERETSEEHGPEAEADVSEEAEPEEEEEDSKTAAGVRWKAGGMRDKLEQFRKTREVVNPGADKDSEETMTQKLIEFKEGCS